MIDVILIHSYHDYAPFIVLKNDGETCKRLYSGDNMHEMGYEKYAEGYADAIGVEVINVNYEELDELDDWKEVLESIGEYAMFKDFFVY